MNWSSLEFLYIYIIIYIYRTGAHYIVAHYCDVFEPATQVDQCPNRQRRVQFFVNQTTNDGYLVFDPNPSSGLTASVMATASTERHVAEDQRHPTSGRGSGSASSQSPPASDASSRHLPESGDTLRGAPPVVGVESCPWTISAKPGTVKSQAIHPFYRARSQPTRGLYRSSIHTIENWYQFAEGLV